MFNSRGTRTMLTRRRALAILGAAGIGTGVFQRALAAKADEGSISPQMVADAEWVAGIKLTAAQREAAANHLNKYRESTKRIRAIELDNSQRPGLVFKPLTSPASQPDPRGYQVVAAPMAASRALVRPNSDEDFLLDIAELILTIKNRNLPVAESILKSIQGKMALL